jgi:hypothetical protein
MYSRPELILSTITDMRSSLILVKEIKMKAFYNSSGKQCIIFVRALSDSLSPRYVLARHFFTSGFITRTTTAYNNQHRQRIGRVCGTTKP